VVAVVTHGGVLRALLVGTLMMSREAAFRLDLSYGSVTIIDWLDATPVVRVLNATAQGVATRGGGFDVAYSRDEGVRTST
jgi:broad specificity phosphatase PhoE